MQQRRYLPSKQFTILAVALLISAGLVYTADAITKPHSANSIVTEQSQAADVTIGSNTDWKAALNQVQQQSGISIPQAPDSSLVDQELQAAQSSNVTESISRTLFVNLANAKLQGMGNDIPTQNDLVSKALSQIPNVAPSKTYTQSDLPVRDTSDTSLRAYGNATMSIFLNNSDQEYGKTLVIVDSLTTTNDGSKVALLQPIKKKYLLIAAQLAAVPVPKILLPFHLALINDYEKIAATYDGLSSFVSDPIAGISAFQQYNNLTKDAGQMFINIAQQLDKNAIIFNTNEPGATWAAFLQAQQQ